MKAKILVVEDDPSILTLEKRVIEHLGCQVLSAANADEAFEMVCREKPDAIVLDVILPGSDGYTLAKKLKSGSDTKDIPIGFVSAKNDPVEMAKGFHCGGAIYLAKPFDVRALKTAVQSLLMLRCDAARGSLAKSEEELILPSFDRLLARIEKETS